MFELKPLHREGIPSALEKAKHYRLLNEPLQAESICLDILEIEPNHIEAIVNLLLALTDQFDHDLKGRFKKARELLAQFPDEYRKVYYGGIICERRANVHRKRLLPGSNHVAYEWYVQAMKCYEDAAAMSSPENNDAILRWNTCARIISRYPELKPDVESRAPFLLE